MKGEYGKDGCYTSFLLSVALAVTPQNLFLAVYFSYLKAHSDLMASISHVINLMKASCCHGDVSRRWRRRRRSRWRRRMRKTELLRRSMRHDHQLIAWNSHPHLHLLSFSLRLSYGETTFMTASSNLVQQSHNHTGPLWVLLEQVRELQRA